MLQRAEWHISLDSARRAEHFVYMCVCMCVCVCADFYSHSLFSEMAGPIFMKLIANERSSCPIKNYWILLWSDFKFRGYVSKCENHKTSLFQKLHNRFEQNWYQKNGLVFWTICKIISYGSDMWFKSYVKKRVFEL